MIGRLQELFRYSSPVTEKKWITIIPSLFYQWFPKSPRKSCSNLLSSSQSGFQENFSTEIRKHMDNGLFTGAVFTDSKKAFDTIVHRILLNKLQRCGVCDRTLLWFSSYLQGHSQRVEVDKVLSSSSVIASGVTQGSILDTLLFILYINDMPSRICFSLS